MSDRSFTETDLRTWSYDALANEFSTLGDTITSLEEILQAGAAEFATDDMTSQEVVRCGRGQDLIIREMTSRKDPEVVAADLSIGIDELTRRMATSS